MPAPRKFDLETRERAVRMYLDRLAEHGGSKREARRRVGALLDINEASIRNWVEAGERTAGVRPGVSRQTDSEEVRSLKRRVAELERANEILKTARRPPSGSRWPPASPGSPAPTPGSGPSHSSWYPADHPRRPWPAGPSGAATQPRPRPSDRSPYTPGTHCRTPPDGPTPSAPHDPAAACRYCFGMTSILSQRTGTEPVTLHCRPNGECVPGPSAGPSYVLHLFLG